MSSNSDEEKMSLQQRKEVVNEHKKEFIYYQGARTMEKNFKIGFPKIHQWFTNCNFYLGCLGEDCQQQAKDMSLLVEHKDLEKLVYPVDRQGVDRWDVDPADKPKVSSQYWLTLVDNGQVTFLKVIILVAVL